MPKKYRSLKEIIAIDEWFYDVKLLEVDHIKKTVLWLSESRRDALDPERRLNFLKTTFKHYTILNPSSIRRGNKNDLKWR